MVVKDVDSFMTCGAVLAQMPKSEQHLPIPCNTLFPFPNQNRFLISLPQADGICMHKLYSWIAHDVIIF